MFKNYGDKNFFEYGRLVCIDRESRNVNVLCCDFDSDSKKYLFARCCMDIDDIIVRYHDINEEGFDAKDDVKLSLAAVEVIDYFGSVNVSCMDYCYEYREYSFEEVIEILKNYDIEPGVVLEDIA